MGMDFIPVRQDRWHQFMARCRFWLASRGEWGSSAEAWIFRNLTREGRHLHHS